MSVTGPLPTLIVWQLITDFRYRLRNSRIPEMLSHNYLWDDRCRLYFLELITMTITVTDPDFSFSKLD